MEVSKNIEDGSVVTWRGDKLVLASKRTKHPVGVFNTQSAVKGFTFSGEKFSFEIPAGVRTYGEAHVKIGKEKK